MSMGFDFFKLTPQLGKIGFGVGGFIAFGGFVYGAKNCMYNVDAGHRSILFNRITGLGDKVYSEGTHFMIPWFNRPIIYDVRTRPRILTSLTGSRDLQMVNITCRVLSRPDEAKLSQVYRYLGRDYDEKVLPSVINEVLKSVVRELVSRSVRDQLVERARDFNILLDDVSLVRIIEYTKRSVMKTHVSFSPEYEKAVESKQVAQQQAERAKYIVQRALEEKKSVIIKAQGEQQAAKLIGEAIKNNPGFVELRRFEAAKDISQVISSSPNRVLLSADTLLLDLWSDSKASKNLEKFSNKSK